MTVAPATATEIPAALREDGTLKLVIFDCDGVLVDGEHLSTAKMAEEARHHGWNISNAEAHRIFTGGELVKIGERIGRETGKNMPADWDMMMQERIVKMMETEAVTIDGAHDMLERVHALGLPIRIGSNSSGAEMDAKFSSTGLDVLIEGERIHSGRDLEMPKPRPDLYLHAAEREGVAPENCIVLEDSDTGAEAARRAGMACVMLRDLDKPAPNWPGLLRIGHLSEFPPLLEKILAAQSADGCRAA